MKHRYLLTILWLLAGQRAAAQATLWRPFRPGFVYSFQPSSGGATPEPEHTLRVDSAYVTAAGDSVYAFNSLLRALPGNSRSFIKSHNNLPAARLRWRPGTADYYLEADAEPALGAAAPVALLLRPRAAVGSTWVASAQPALTATLSRREPAPSGLAADSVATITLSNGQALTLSRRAGLLAGPQWLALGAGGSAARPATYEPAEPPQPGLGEYDPRRLLALAVGDELGYELTDYAFGGPLVCRQGCRLRRITGRQLTADSLVLRYNEQEQFSYSTFPSCGSPGPARTPVRAGRWAVALRTGQSPQFRFLALLSGEYRAQPGGSSLLVGQGLRTLPAGSNCLAGARIASFGVVYPVASSPGQYKEGLDDGALSYEFSPTLGVGPVAFATTVNHPNRLVHYQRNGVACGSVACFATLLPTRAALAAATATLAPNPAADAATLTLAAPAPPGTTLTLTDALGRRVWSAPVPAGQLALPLPLAGQPAGLYLVQLHSPGPGALPLTWKLQRNL